MASWSLQQIGRGCITSNCLAKIGRNVQLQSPSLDCFVSNHLPWAISLPHCILFLIDKIGFEPMASTPYRLLFTIMPRQHFSQTGILTMLEL